MGINFPAPPVKKSMISCYSDVEYLEISGIIFSHFPDHRVAALSQAQCSVFQWVHQDLHGGIRTNKPSDETQMQLKGSQFLIFVWSLSS